ncbi:MAG: hypothetical protein J6T01_00380 [Kiritimatiellae bacterium]|nr:hypothetical protein [Kiritimatiellia bacterium]
MNSILCTAAAIAAAGLCRGATVAIPDSATPVELTAAAKRLAAANAWPVNGPYGVYDRLELEFRPGANTVKFKSLSGSGGIWYFSFMMPR